MAGSSYFTLQLCYFFELKFLGFHNIYVTLWLSTVVLLLGIRVVRVSQYLCNIIKVFRVSQYLWGFLLSNFSFKFWRKADCLHSPEMYKSPFAVVFSSLHWWTRQIVTVFLLFSPLCFHINIKGHHSILLSFPTN